MTKEISKEELSTFPIGKFEGPIHLIDQRDQVAEALEKMGSHKVLGFDTETKPSFRKGVVHKVALLQIASSSEVWIFRLNHIGLPDELAAFLSSPDHFFIGIAVHDDVKDLQKLNRNYKPQNMVDLNRLAQNMGFESIGAKKLSALVLGFTVSKSEQTSNWENKVLTKGQLTYAATDAWICHLIYHKLMEI